MSRLVPKPDTSFLLPRLQFPPSGEFQPPPAPPPFIPFVWTRAPLPRTPPLLRSSGPKDRRRIINDRPAFASASRSLMSRRGRKSSVASGLRERARVCDDDWSSVIIVSVCAMVAIPSAYERGAFIH